MASTIGRSIPGLASLADGKRRALLAEQEVNKASVVCLQPVTSRTLLHPPECCTPLLSSLLPPALIADARSGKGNYSNSVYPQKGSVCRLQGLIISAKYCCDPDVSHDLIDPFCVWLAPWGLSNSTCGHLKGPCKSYSESNEILFYTDMLCPPGGRIVVFLQMFLTVHNNVFLLSINKSLLV